jgi:hypothetical protein
MLQCGKTCRADGQHRRLKRYTEAVLLHDPASDAHIALHKIGAFRTRCVQAGLGPAPQSPGTTRSAPRARILHTMGK